MPGATFLASDDSIESSLAAFSVCFTRMLRTLLTCALLAYAGCKSDASDTSDLETSAGPTKGSAGGFSASLSAELGSGGSSAGSAGSTSGSGGSATSAGSTSGSDTSTANGTGSGSAVAMAAGSGAKAGAGSAGSTTGSGAKAGSGSAAPVASGSGAGSAAPVASGSGAKAGSGSAAPVASGSAAPVASGSGAGSAVTPPKPVMTPELAAIKLTLQANWDRDVIEAGSLSLFEKNSNATFKFNYGYEDAKAPTEREAYKKFLADAAVLTVRADRQSGAAWYLEGTDASGHAAFRIVVKYGGKRLICYGSLYKDSGLGDLRDSVLIQAKQICEGIQL